MSDNRVLDGLMGLCVGDTLGLPMEGVSREALRRNPVTGMTGFPHGLPPGTWSDDSSLTFCLAESLCSSFNLTDIASRFCAWLYEGYWTPYGEAIGMGRTSTLAIARLRHGAEPLEAGGRGEMDNGNGSLMRILPMAFYVHGLDLSKAMELTHQVSCLTHAHARSQMACGIYVQMALGLLEGRDIRAAYKTTRRAAHAYYDRIPFEDELTHFKRVLEGDISELPESEINSGGYAVETLEAALWCLLKEHSYAGTVLRAVNLGGLAGLHYGIEAIPSEWQECIARREEIVALANRLDKALAADRKA